MSRTLFVRAQQKLAALEVWSIETYFLNFVSFGLGINLTSTFLPAK